MKKIYIAGIVLLAVVVVVAVVLLSDFDGDGVSNFQELRLGTGMFMADSDGDGLLDGTELSLGTNPLLVDTDGDSLSDKAETDGWWVNHSSRYLQTSDPLKSDTDSDGLSDFQEFEARTDPRKSDTDDDGLNDFQEYEAGTNPLKSDTDSDGLSDAFELQPRQILVNGAYQSITSDPLKADTDGDGLCDENEYRLGTNPRNSDSDGDDLSDYAEVVYHSTNSTHSDTDNDGLSDGREITLGTNPLLVDTDKDGIWDGFEVDNMAQFGANPLRRDIFVEIDKVEDWYYNYGGENILVSYRWLNSTEKTTLINMFKNAPIENPDGSFGVDLHLIDDDVIPFIDIYYENGFTDSRKIHEVFINYRDNYKIYDEGFYYCVLGLGAFSYGSGFSLPITGESDASKTFLHELGHSLGLMPSIFDGIDSRKYTSEQYPSVMNYEYVGSINYSNGGVFNDWAYLQEHGFSLHKYFYGF